MQGSPRGGGEAPPLLGDHLHSLSNTREIRTLSDGLGKVFFLDYLEIFLKPEGSGVQGVQPSRGGGRVSRVGGFGGMRVRNEGGRREGGGGREQVKNRTFTKG